MDEQGSGEAASERLIGRSDELGELTDRLGQRRLVTVIGPGGIGKTTLAQAAAEELVQHQEMVLRFVDLARVDDPAAVESTMAAQLGYPSFGALLESPVDQGILVLVDNCEQVTDAAAAAVSSLLGSLPTATVLATSRSPLDLPGEALIPLGPLETPATGAPSRRVAAIALFCARAEDAGVPVLDVDLEDVCQLCRRLDGVPLAIEIAAARTRSMSPAEIVAELDDRLDVLSRPRFRGERRHRSLRDTIEWSYKLLTEDEQRLFDRLGVIAGPFSASMAHGIAGEPGGPQSITLDGLDALVSASMVVATRGAGAVTWYRLLDTMRTFASERLETMDALAETRERFIDHTALVAHEVAQDARAGWKAQHLATIISLQGNFLVALRWCLAKDKDPQRALRLLTIMWAYQLHTAEVADLGADVLSRWPDPMTPMWADGAATVAACWFVHGRHDEAYQLANRATATAGESQFAPVTLARVQGQIKLAAGRSGEALELFTKASDEAAHRGLSSWVIELECLRAEALAQLGEVDEALGILSAQRAAATSVASTLSQIMVLSTEGHVLLRVDPERAIPIIDAALTAARETGYPSTVAINLRTLALARFLTGDSNGAAGLLLDLIDEVVKRSVIAQNRNLVATAAVVLEREQRPGWENLAATARSLPAVGFLDSVGREIVPLPDHSNGFVLTLSDAVDLARRELTALRDLAPARSRDSPVDRPSALKPNTFVRGGDFWEIQFSGRHATLKDTKGMADLARLLAAPGVEISSLELMGAAVTSPDTGAVIDPTARRQYEQRIRDLQETIEEAEAANDFSRAELASTELDTIVDHLSAALGTGDRARRTGSTAEKARSAVTQRIRSTIRRIGEAHPELANHLETAVVTGVYCCYQPGPDITWST